MADKTFTLMATVTASTTRRPNADAGELFQVPASSIASLKCTPLDQLDAETAHLFGLMTPYTSRQTFVQSGLDIVKGDILTVGSTAYDIRSVESYQWTPDSAAVYARLILELAE